MERIQLNREDLIRYTGYAKECARIDPDLYGKYDVKRGLRDISGKGVLAGLTEISEIRSYVVENNDLIPCEGKLYYRGYDVEELVGGFFEADRFGFEEIAFLLIFGHLPDSREYASFRKDLSALNSFSDVSLL